METAFVSETTEIEFEALEFEAGLIGNVAQTKNGKIRLSRNRTQTGELGIDDFNLVVPFDFGIGKGDQMAAMWIGQVDLRVWRANEDSNLGPTA